jgi:toxin CcdB
MAQFDVYLNRHQQTRQEIPFLLDLQADILDNLVTRVVVPLYSIAAFGIPARHLNPRFSVNQKDVIMSTAELAGVPTMILGDKIASLAEKRDEIIAALDFLFTGF